MKSGKQKQKASSRVAMSEPHLRKRRAADLDDSTAGLKGVQSRTVQKRRSMSGRELIRWQREQLKQKAEETISKRLFVDSEKMTFLGDDSGSPHLKDRSDGSQEHEISLDSTLHDKSAMSSIGKGKKGKGGALKVATSTPKTVATSTPEVAHNKSPNSKQPLRDAASSINKSRSKQDKKTPKSATRKGVRRQDSGSSAKSDSHTLDRSLDSTLPMDESSTGSDVGKASRSDDDDSAVTFPNTPVPPLKTPAHGTRLRKNKTMKKLDTPAVKKETPMPVDDEQWKDDVDTPVVGKQEGDWKKSLSRVKREKRKKQFLVKCSNIPKGVTPELFAMFLGECEVYPQIRIKRMKRGGKGWKRPPRYAILVCKSKEDYDTLINLDGISIPQLTPKGKEMTLKFMPQMTHSEARSSHALRVTNMAEGVTEEELREFFSRKRSTCGKIQLYPADRAAYVVFKSAGDMRRARRISERKLKGSTMEFKTNKGYINHDVELNLMDE